LGSTIKNDHVYCWKSIAQNPANAAFGGSGLELPRYWAKAVLFRREMPALCARLLEKSAERCLLLDITPRRTAGLDAHQAGAMALTGAERQPD
jgi:hypothetical protein